MIVSGFAGKHSLTGTRYLDATCLRTTRRIDLNQIAEMEEASLILSALRLRISPPC